MAEKQRDMGEDEYRNALARYGFVQTGFMGYVEIGFGVSVSAHNAGRGATRCQKLAYLLQERDRQEKRLATEAEAAR